MEEGVNNFMNQNQYLKTIFDQLLHKFTEEFKSVLYNTYLNNLRLPKKDDSDTVTKTHDFKQTNDDVIHPDNATITDEATHIHDDVTHTNDEIKYDDDDDYFSSTDNINGFLQTMVFFGNEKKNIEKPTVVPNMTDANFPKLPNKRVDGEETKFSEMHMDYHCPRDSWAEVTKRKAGKPNEPPFCNHYLSDESVNMFVVPSAATETDSKNNSVQQKKLKISTPQFMLVEKQGNVFKSNSDSAIACPVDEGLDSTSGLGLQLESRYHVTDVLRAQAKRPGQVGVAKIGKRHVLSLVTKRAPQDTPTLQDVLRALEALKKCCLKLDVHELAMPRFSVQDTTWPELKRHVRQTFCHTDLCLTVYSPRFAGFRDSAVAKYVSGNVRSIVRSVLNVAHSKSETSTKSLPDEDTTEMNSTTTTRNPISPEKKREQIIKKTINNDERKNITNWRFFLKKKPRTSNAHHQSSSSNLDNILQTEDLKLGAEIVELDNTTCITSSNTSMNMEEVSYNKFHL